MAFDTTANPPPAPPQPLPASVKQYNADGTPTAAKAEYDRKVFEYERKLIAWLLLMAAAIP